MSLNFNPVRSPKDLPPRAMPEDQYKEYKQWAQQLQSSFHESISDVFPGGDCVVTDKHILYAKDPRYFDIPYANKTLGPVGCAIFAIEHANREFFTLEELAASAGEKGYYADGVGTYHHLLDQMGAKRLASMQELFDALASGKVVTVLRPGHFFNLVGVEGNMFLVEDSQYQERKRVEISSILQAITIAWSW